MNNDQLDDMKYMLKVSLKAMLDDMYEKFAIIIDNLTSYATAPTPSTDETKAITPPPNVRPHSANKGKCKYCGVETGGQVQGEWCCYDCYDKGNIVTVREKADESNTDTEPVVKICQNCDSDPAVNGYAICHACADDIYNNGDADVMFYNDAENISVLKFLGINDDDPDTGADDDDSDPDPTPDRPYEDWGYKK